MAQISHASIDSEELLHRPKNHPLHSQYHNTDMSGKEYKLISRGASDLSWVTLAEFLAAIPESQKTTDGAMWYDSVTGRFMCRRNGADHVINTTPVEP